MNLSELIKLYGDDQVTFQKLDDCAESLSMNKRGSRITFVTPELIGLNGTVKLGLVVWLDRDRVTAVIAESKRPVPSP